MPTPFVFADGSSSVMTSLIAAAVGAVVVAIAQASVAIYKRARADATAAVPPAQVETCHWADVTGEQRPVTAQECGARMAGLDATIREVRDTLLKMEAQLGDGVELRMQRVARSESNEALGRHEAALHGKRR